MRASLSSRVATVTAVAAGGSAARLPAAVVARARVQDVLCAVEHARPLPAAVCAGATARHSRHTRACARVRARACVRVRARVRACACTARVCVRACACLEHGSYAARQLDLLKPHDARGHRVDLGTAIVALLALCTDAPLHRVLLQRCWRFGAPTAILGMACARAYGHKQDVGLGRVSDAVRHVVQHHRVHHRLQLRVRANVCARARAS
jgi:hypothetical protein